MPAPPRIRILPLAAIALALGVIYLARAPQRPADPAPPEPAVAAPASPAVVDLPRFPDDAPDATRPRFDAPPSAGDVAPTIAVRGRITDAAGSPLGGIPVELQPRGDEAAESIARTRSDRHGEFRFDAVTPGRRYRLRVAPADDYAGYSDEAMVFDAAAPALEIVLEPVVLVDADGIIVDTSQAPVANFTLRLRSAATNIPERVITSDATGYFRLDDFPAGEVEINTSGRDFYRIQGLELRADAYNKLTLVVDRGEYRLSGRISDDAGRPVAGARVTLKGALRQGAAHTYTYRSTQSDADGGFGFTDLGSYSYTLGVHAAGFETQIRNHEFQSFAEHLEIRLQPLPVE